MTIDTDDPMAESEQILDAAGLSYHNAHGPYVKAVAAELERHGLTVTESDHHADDPRSGFITLDARANPADDHLFLVWTDGDGWSYCPVHPGEQNGYTEVDLPVSDLALPAAVAAAMLGKLGREVPQLPTQWQRPEGHVKNFEDIDKFYDYTDPHPELERTLVAYVGYPGAERG